ncbi:hypothetical protein H2203_005057 [Taxawa tesnikishii (nom. ined.)]|nr:hypothetical protein H2203_005057 [Dothideales sp. JES 119]
MAGEVDGFVLVDVDMTFDSSVEEAQASSDYLSSISAVIDKLSPVLRPVSLDIHDHPELGYREHRAHRTLTEFLSTQKGWHVTPHAYGIETAFVAVFDTGRGGPVVSFNAEYGKLIMLGSSVRSSLTSCLIAV